MFLSLDLNRSSRTVSLDFKERPAGRQVINVSCPQEEKVGEAIPLRLM